jgi:hypothetical protein
MPRVRNTPLPQPVFDEPTFNEAAASPDPMRFQTTHPSDNAQYNAIHDLLAKDTVGFDAARGRPDYLFTLQSALGPHFQERITLIETAKKIVFHAAGDTGASSQGKYQNEIRVSDAVTQDYQTAKEPDRPAFFYHLGDVVYSFGESQYYYDQFYEPFRDYPGPIFAVPGNHDSFVIPDTPSDETPLTIFSRNFCAQNHVVTMEARSLHRTAMTQPGVYFTLDAPFVRIIGLFSNALEDPGLISSQKGQKTTWATVPDVQLEYLAAQFDQIKAQKYKGAVLLAVHHPPFSYSPDPQTKGKHGAGGNHSSSSDMLREIDTICVKHGVYPHAFLSGHAHNYQRYTRTVEFSGAKYTVPFVVCGDGGHNVNSIVQARKGQPPVEPAKKLQVDYLESNPALKTGGLILENYDDKNYGYLRIAVTATELNITFQPVGAKGVAHPDAVTVNLATHTVN